MRRNSTTIKSRRVLVRLTAVEAHLKRRIRAHLDRIGFDRKDDGSFAPKDIQKNSIRLLHQHQRYQKYEQHRRFVEQHSASLFQYFASGRDVSPADISPRLELIAAGTWQSDLFRLASLTWSVPVSHGYGRRLRFLIWDDHNQKLIGILALGDPVFNLAARDNLIGWTADERKLRLANIMDAYVLGAVPPYNDLLCGKLISALVKTVEVRDAFRQKYGITESVISGNRRSVDLLMVTTTSALGRSSLYNRSRLGDMELFRRVGFTRGWGHFHIPDELFADVRKYLSSRGHRYANGNRFGQGPNWRLRTMREGLKLLGMNEGLLRHGIGREVFICEIATNAQSVLSGKRKRPIFQGLLSVAEVARLAKTRWIIPRSIRKTLYLSCEVDQLKKLIVAAVYGVGKKEEPDCRSRGTDRRIL